MKFLIPDSTGHSVVEFDKLDAADMRRAAKMFDELVKDKRKTAYTRGGGGGNARITREFDPNAEETVFFSHLQGG